jgi:hypothetical protein
MTQGGASKMTSIMPPQKGGGAGKGKKPARGKGGAAKGAPLATDTLIHIVLDKSGSMQAVRQATIEGFNRFKHDQLEGGGDARVSLTLFDSGVNEVCSAVPLRELTDLDTTNYRPDGTTALYDAIGAAITRTDALIATKVVEPQRVLFAIVTDGEENSSRRYQRSAIFEMVRAHEEAGWSFVFLGANIDSYAASQSVGVAGAARARDWAHTPEEMAKNMRVLSHATSRWRDDSLPEVHRAGREFFNDEDEKAGDE